MSAPPHLASNVSCESMHATRLSSLLSSLVINPDDPVEIASEQSAICPEGRSCSLIKSLLFRSDYVYCRAICEQRRTYHQTDALIVH